MADNSSDKQVDDITKYAAVVRNMICGASNNLARKPDGPVAALTFISNIAAFTIELIDYNAAANGIEKARVDEIINMIRADVRKEFAASQVVVINSDGLEQQSGAA